MNQLLIDLKNKLNPIVELIKDKNDVFYFDYPLHLNVGDLLIYHGTEQFFKDHHINVTLKRCEYDLDLEEVKAKITPNTTILLHGGGNFGDLYPQHQKIREEIVTNFPNNRIIVLPPPCKRMVVFGVIFALTSLRSKSYSQSFKVTLMW